MVDCQIQTAGVVTEGLLKAFEVTPRELFVPEKLKSIAYSDEDIPLGKGRFLLEPIVHAKLVEAARIQPTDVVMDIGMGTGYSSAILSPMVLTVMAVDSNKKYLDKAARLWAELDVCNVIGIEGDLTEGNPENAPFSLIFVNGAVAEIPENLVDQLGPGGRLLTVVKKAGAVMGHATLVEKLDTGGYASTELFEAGTPYLAGI